MSRIFAAAIIGAAITLAPGAEANPAAPLHVDVYVADDAHYGVTSTLIYGPTEAILVDAQFSNQDAERLANRVTATGRKLKAIFITHPDVDHYLGLAVLHRRFPSAPIYMTPRSLAFFERNLSKDLASMKSWRPSEVPNDEPTPKALPRPHLIVDGRRVDIIENLQGDYSAAPANNPVWIPGQRTLVADDLAFNGVHPWLEGSTEVTRRAWRASLARLRFLNPVQVIAGHKRSPDLPDSPGVLTFMDRYLETFDQLRRASPDAQSLIARMTARFPDLGETKFLTIAAKSVYPAGRGQSH